MAVTSLITLACILVVLFIVLFLAFNGGKKQESESFAGNSKPDDNVLLALAMAGGATFVSTAPVLAGVLEAQEKQREARKRGESDGGDGGVMLSSISDSGASSSDGGDSSCGGGGCGD